MHPFQVTKETKRMVMENICFLLNNYIKCSAYENIVFCWVMHEQSIIDDILSHLNTANAVFILYPYFAIKISIYIIPILNNKFNFSHNLPSQSIIPPSAPCSTNSFPNHTHPSGRNQVLAGKKEWTSGSVICAGCRQELGRRPVDLVEQV